MRLFRKAYYRLSEEEQKLIKKDDLSRMIVLLGLDDTLEDVRTLKDMYDTLYDFFLDHELDFEEVEELLENCLYNRIQLEDYTVSEIKEKCSKRGSLRNYIDFVLNEFIKKKQTNKFVRDHHFRFLRKKRILDEITDIPDIEEILNTKLVFFDSPYSFFEYTSIYSNGIHSFIRGIYKVIEKYKGKKVVYQDQDSNIFQLRLLSDFEPYKKN